MINAANACTLIRENDTFSSNAPTDVNEAEESIASHLINLLQELSVSDDYVVETEESLDKRDDEEPDFDEIGRAHV